MTPNNSGRAGAWDSEAQRASAELMSPSKPGQSQPKLVWSSTSDCFCQLQSSATQSSLTGTKHQSSLGRSVTALCQRARDASDRRGDGIR